MITCARAKVAKVAEVEFVAGDPMLEAGSPTNNAMDWAHIP